MFEVDKQKQEELKKEIVSLTDMVSTLKINLDNGNLNLNEDINKIIAKIRYVGNLKKDVMLSKEENKNFEVKFTQIKKEFTKYKGLHLHRYNEKIQEIKLRYSKLVQVIIDKDLDIDIKNRIKEIPRLNKCDVLINNSQWTQNRYLDTLEYDKIDYVVKEISELENILKVKNDNLLELRSILKDIEELVNTMKLNINKGLTIENINIYLNEYPVALNRLLALETKHERLRNVVSKTSFGVYSNKIVVLKNELTKCKDRLLEEKKKLDEKESVYNHLDNSLDVINEEYKTLKTTIIDNMGKGSETLVNTLNTKLDSYFKNLNNVKEEIKKYINDGKLNQVQVDNLNNIIDEIEKLHDEIDLKLNVELVVLDDEKKN